MIRYKEWQDSLCNSQILGKQIYLCGMGGERLFLIHKSFKKVMSLDVNWHSAGPKCIAKLQALENLNPTG